MDLKNIKCSKNVRKNTLQEYFHGQAFLRLTTGLGTTLLENNTKDLPLICIFLIHFH